ncbi:MAG: division/cell wall cluster transcriptional repressor MraZ [Anaerolineales bacterium]|nr:division/cell wall cluster transcriptional repressor MraZ [Anaerolineales bacterium]
MFLGEYTHTIDEKGRLTVPARFRQLLEADGGYVTRGLDGNLTVMRRVVFENMRRNLETQSVTNPKVRDLARLLFGQAELQKPDGSGRILIPQFLRDEFQLNGEVALVGIGHSFEIWPLARWSGKKQALTKLHEDGAQFADIPLIANES